MARPRRPILAGCSGLLLLATAALWVWTRYEGHAAVAYTGGRRWDVRTAPGCLYFAWAPGPRTWRHIDYAGDGYIYRAWYPGSRAFLRVEGTIGDARLWVPLWIPMVGALGMLWWWVPLRRRPTIGHCATCGYDLLGNVSGVCPECGTNVDLGGNVTRGSSETLSKGKWAGDQA